jgi:thioredoxin reductase
MREVDLLIVGGGPAGQAAALTGAAHAVEALLVDEGPIPPSWMSRQVPYWYGERSPVDRSDDDIRGRYLDARPKLARAHELGVDVRIGTTCWGLFDGQIAGLYDGARAELVRWRQVILATGSTDMPLAFPGRSLPGVLGGLAALDLLATRGSLGGSRVVVLGAGMLGLEVARRARDVGHTVVAIADIATEPAGDPAMLAELESSGVECIPGYTVAYATGDQQLEQVMLVGVGADGERIAGASFPVRADTLVVAIGRAPAIELPYLIECDFRFDAQAGGYLPAQTSDLATSVPGVFVAGDVAGAPDATFGQPSVAEQQGRLAAMAAARALGKPLAAVSADLDWSLPSRTAEAAPFTRWHQAALRLAPDDAVICRCEGVTRHELLDAIAVVGDDVPDEVKRVTRAGMGVCQGRGCRLLVAGLLAERQGVAFDSIPLGSYRPPIRPIPLAALASVNLPEERLLPAFAALERQLADDAARGLIPEARYAASHYKLREENHLALVAGLSDEETEKVARALRETVRHVTVH